MNLYEQSKLNGKVKGTIRELFNWFEESSYLCSAGLPKQLNDVPVEEINVLDIVTYVLNATLKRVNVECDYNNEYLEDDTRSGKFFIWGETKIGYDLENVISIQPSSHFTYVSEYDDLDDPQDYSGPLLQHLNIRNINMYRGSFSYAGIAREKAEGVGTTFDSMKLFNEVQVIFIEDGDPAWKKHIAESYRLFDGGAYRLAFLIAFIGLDSLIELTNETLKDVYYSHENENIDFQLKYYNRELWNAVDLMRDEVLESQTYKRLVKLEKSRRKLIQEKLVTVLQYTNDWEKNKCKEYVRTISFFNEVRNALAHGNDVSDIQKKGLLKRYQTENTSGYNFEKLYIDLLINICHLIETLRS